MRPAIKILLVIAIIGGGVLVAMALIKTRPTAQRKAISVGTPRVEVMTAQPETRQTTITAMGTVVPAREVTLQPQVSGHIVKVSPTFMPGGRFSEGEVILKIDQRDYEIAVQQARAQVSQAQVELKTERGRGAVAKKEWDLLGGEIRTTPEGKSLALRVPQLENARAALESAKSSLAKAQLDLERTVIRAPFNCFVREKNVDVGQFVTASAPLATLVGTDRFWVRVSVPVDKLPVVQASGPEPFVSESEEAGSEGEAMETSEMGSKVRVIQEGQGANVRRVVRHGRVVRFLGDMDPRGRMARVLVEVADPLGIAAGDPSAVPLLVDAYVRAEIEGPAIADAFPLPPRAIRDDGRVWIVDEENLLAFRDVEPVWETADEVLVRGLETGDRVVLSRIGTPVAGMELRVGDDEMAGVEGAEDAPGSGSDKSIGGKPDGESRPAAASGRSETPRKEAAQ
jgi:RND family efflux transporter MFP subunit